MRIIYVTDDEEEFESIEEAKAHEKDLMEEEIKRKEQEKKRIAKLEEVNRAYDVMLSTRSAFMKQKKEYENEFGFFPVENSSDIANLIRCCIL